MARSRNIKPGFFLNDTLGELKPLSRLLFIGLWCIADRAGRLEDRPNKIKIQVLPYDNCNIDTLLEELNNSGFITRYSIEGQKYIEITNFSKHQNPHKNEPDSVIAPMAEGVPYNSDSPRDKNGSAPADSLNLIPDSLNMITHVPKSKQENTPFQEIVNYLNEKAGTKYRASSQEIQKHIKARLNDKFTVDDFKTVIDKKVASWKDDPEMAKYLRPSTLFGTKFEQYLNEVAAKPQASAKPRPKYPGEPEYTVYVPDGLRTKIQDPPI